MGPPVGHGVKLTELRQRTESEKRRVIEYLDNKMETEILQDMAEFWVRQEKRVLMKEESQKGWKMFASTLGNKKIAKTPKRKLAGKNTHAGSPGKRLKINFEENLNFWRAKSDIHEQTNTLEIKEVLPKNSDKGRTIIGLTTDWWGSDLDKPNQVKLNLTEGVVLGF